MFLGAMSLALRVVNLGSRHAAHLICYVRPGLNVGPMEFNYGICTMHANNFGFISHLWVIVGRVLEIGSDIIWHNMNAWWAIRYYVELQVYHLVKWICINASSNVALWFFFFVCFLFSFSLSLVEFHLAGNCGVFLYLGRISLYLKVRNLQVRKYENFRDFFVYLFWARKYIFTKGWLWCFLWFRCSVQF